MAAGTIAALFGGQAQAVVCTGTTMTVANGGVVPGSFLLGAGNCVDAGDKTFGQFSVNGVINGSGSASFNFPTVPGNVTIAFLGTVGAGQTGGLAYNVAVNPALSGTFLIDDLEKDITLNAVTPGVLASADLTGTVNPGAIAFACTRTVNPSGGTCPVTHIFTPVTEISVTESITAAANTTVTALTDTVSQAAQGVPEPASLALLGSALVSFGVFGIRRRRQS